MSKNFHEKTGRNDQKCFFYDKNFQRKKIHPKKTVTNGKKFMENRK